MRIFKVINVLLLYSFVSASAYAGYLRSNVGLSAGYLNIAMTKWNEDVNEKYNEYILQGFNPTMYLYRDSLDFNVFIENQFEFSVGRISFDIKYSYLHVFTPDNNTYWPDGTLYENTHTGIYTSFAGIGTKYMHSFDRMEVYAGFDLGMYLIEGRQDIKGFYEDGTILKDYVLLFHIPQCNFWGGNLTAGTNYWINELVAFSLETGYRFGTGNITSYKNDTISDRVVFNVDYSGFFIKTGLIFNIWK